jgi:hypothetical protein
VNMMSTTPTSFGALGSTGQRATHMHRPKGLLSRMSFAWRRWRGDPRLVAELVHAAAARCGAILAPAKVHVIRHHGKKVFTAILEIPPKDVAMYHGSRQAELAVVERVRSRFGIVIEHVAFVPDKVQSLAKAQALDDPDSVRKYLEVLRRSAVTAQPVGALDPKGDSRFGASRLPRGSQGARSGPSARQAVASEHSAAPALEVEPLPQDVLHSELMHDVLHGGLGLEVLELGDFEATRPYMSDSDQKPSPSAASPTLPTATPGMINFNLFSERAEG